MSRTRLTAVVVTLGLGAAGLVPAAAAPPPAAALHASPRAALSAALAGLRPDAQSVEAWRTAMQALAAKEGEGSAGESTAVPVREYADVYEVGDVDGDGRDDVAVLRADGTLVRSGRDGHVLLGRESGLLFGLAGTGRVRLLWWDVDYVDREDSYEMQQTLQGLDGRGRTVWTHESTGQVAGSGFGPAYVNQLQTVPAFFDLDQVDATGRPAALIGSLTATSLRATNRSALQLSTLSLTDGTLTELDAVEGTGRGYAEAWPVKPSKGAGTCYATVTPTGAISQVGVACDGGEPEWSTVVRLREGYLDADAGDFDGDGLDDLSITTYGPDEPKPTQVLRGTHVLSRADGSLLGSSALSNLSPTGGDVDGDGRPDFQRFLSEGDEEGIAVQGVNLTGDELYRARLGTDGQLEAYLGVDVDGDTVCDAVLRSQPRRGEPVTVVVDGRTGTSRRTTGVDGLVWPGLRSTGIDLAVVRNEGRRLRTTVLSGDRDRGRRLLDVQVPGPAGTPTFGAAGTADVDGDRRRDLVVASRTGNRRLTTAYSAAGRLLWQTSEKVVPQPADKDVWIGFAG